MKTEQARFEAWLDRTRPSGDVESVQHRWLESSDYAYFCEERRKERMKIDDMCFDINPDVVYWLVSIDDDRYGGCYSGHRFTAWPGLRPDDIDAGDGTCEDFWKKHGATALYGGGTTAKEALHDLLKKISWDTDSIRCIYGVAGQEVIARGTPEFAAITSIESNRLCSVCREPQFESPSGTACPNGHGGDEGVPK